VDSMRQGGKDDLHCWMLAMITNNEGFSRKNTVGIPLSSFFTHPVTGKVSKIFKVLPYERMSP